MSDMVIVFETVKERYRVYVTLVWGKNYTFAKEFISGNWETVVAWNGSPEIPVVGTAAADHSLNIWCTISHFYLHPVISNIYKSVNFNSGIDVA